MSKHMDLVRTAVASDRVRAFGEAMGRAVAVTGDELVTARAGFFRGGNKVERHPLDRMTSMRVLPNPHASLIEVSFEDSAALKLMFQPPAREHFERIVEVLREHLGRNGGTAPAAQLGAANGKQEGAR